MGHDESHRIDKNRAHAAPLAAGSGEAQEAARPWMLIGEGRYQPRRIRGSYRGRELG